jgi:hypothetical protein
MACQPVAFPEKASHDFIKDFVLRPYDSNDSNEAARREQARGEIKGKEDRDESVVHRPISMSSGLRRRRLNLDASGTRIQNFSNVARARLRVHLQRDHRPGQLRLWPPPMSLKCLRSAAAALRAGLQARPM